MKNRKATCKGIDGNKRVSKISLFSKANKEGSDFFVATSYFSIIRAYARNKLGENVFASVFNLCFKSRKKMTFDDYNKVIDLVDSDLLNGDFTTSDNIDKTISKVVDFFKGVLENEFKSIKNHYTGVKRSYNVTNMDDYQIKECMIFINSLLKSPTLEIDIENFVRDKIKELQESTLTDLSMLGESIFVLKIVSDLDEAIKTKEFFKVEEIELRTRSMTVNGEYFRFVNSRPYSEEVIVNNHVQELSVVANENVFVCLKKEDAYSLGKEKVKALRKALSEFERVSF